MNLGSFPIFGATGQEGDLSDSTGASSPSGTTFAAPEPTPLPRVHDGTDERHAEELFRAVRRATNPRLADAVEAEERARAVVAEWEGRATQLQLVVNTAKNSMLTTPGDQPGLRQERSNALKQVQAQFAEACEEATAAREELAVATANVRAVTP